MLSLVLVLCSGLLIPVQAVPDITIESVLRFNLTGMTNADQETTVIFNTSNALKYLRFYWDYGDGQRDSEIIMTEYSQRHVYMHRDVYNARLTVLSTVTNDFTSVNYTVVVGGIQLLQCYPLVVQDNTTYDLRYKIIDDSNIAHIVTETFNTSDINISEYYITGNGTGVDETITNPCNAILRYDKENIYLALNTTMTDNTSMSGEKVPFKLYGDYDSKNGMKSCNMDFGDMRHSSDSSLSESRTGPNKLLSTWEHKYLETGQYTAKAYCWKNDSYVESETLTITVTQPLSSINVLTDTPVFDLAKPVELKLELILELEGLLSVLDTRFSVDWGDGVVNDTKVFELQHGTNLIPHAWHLYSHPGNFSVTVSGSGGYWSNTYLQKVSESLNFELELMNSSLTMLSEVDFILNVTNPPTYEISYTLDMGDAKFINPITHDATGLTDLFTGFPHNLEFYYHYGGNYTVDLTGNNEHFHRTYTLDIMVLQGTPIRGWSLELSNDDALIIDESPVRFILAYTLNKTKAPTVLVNCRLDYGDGNHGEMTIITFPTQVDLPWLYHYDQTGMFTVTLLCENQYRSHNMSLNVTVQTYNQTEYIFTYVEALGINGTITTKNKQQTQFSFNLYDISYVFPHSSEWDFGDRTEITTIDFESWERFHLYEERGIYDGNVTVFTPKGNFTYYFVVYIGVSVVTLESPETTPKTPLDIGVEELRYLSFTSYINYGDGNDHTQNCEKNCTFTHSFASAGFYSIKSVLTVGSVVETLTFKAIIFIDNPIVGLTLDLTELNIVQPPGIVEVNIALDEMALPINYMECEVNLGDRLNQKKYHLQGGLQPTETFFMSESYLSLGSHTVSVNCSNRLGYQELSQVCHVRSLCFGGDGIFDESYADPANPLLIMASSEVEVTSRAIIRCKGTHVFTWSLWTLNKTTFENKILLPIYQPNKDSYRIKKGTFEPGMYSLNLNISLVYQGGEDWLYGLTYMTIIGSPLIIKIKGGSIRATGYNKAIIDARSLSVDPDKPGRNKDYLIFEWTCQYFLTYNATDLDRSIQRGELGTDIPCENITREIQPGLLQFHDLPNEEKGYSFRVTAKTMHKETDDFAISYVQYTKGAPDLDIACTVNCEIKVSQTVALVMEVVCEYCFKDEFYLADIRWILKKYDARDNLILVPNLDDISDIVEDNPGVIILKKNTLTPCETYRLEVEVDIETREAKGTSFITFVVNCPPSGGMCSTVPSQGEVRSTEFRTTCRNWVDDGYAFTGIKKPGPFIYKFYINQGIYMLPLFQGAQAMTPKEPLPVIPGTKGGSYKIICRIFDTLKDYAEFNTTIQLSVPVLHSLDQTGSAVGLAEFTSAMATDTSVLSKQLVQTTYSSSILQTVDVNSVNRFVGEYANGDDSTVDGGKVSWNEVWSKFVSARDDKELKDKLAEKYKRFVNQLQNKRDDIDSLDGHGLEALGEALSTVMNSEDTVDFEISDLGYDLVNSGVAMLESLSTKEPFPIEDKIDDVVFALTGALDKVYNKNSPTYHTVDQTFDINAEGVGEDEKQSFSYLIMKEQAAMDEMKIKNGRNVLPSVENATDKLLTAMLRDQVKGQRSKGIRREGVFLNARKITARSLKDSGFEADTFSMTFPTFSTNTSWNVTDQINLKAAVTKKNMYSWAKDGSSYDITSPVLSLRIDDENGTSQFDGNVSLTIKREMPEFKTYYLNETQQGEEGLCHHQFQVKKTSDINFIYVDIGQYGTEVSALVRNGLPPSSYADNVKRYKGEYINWQVGKKRKKRAPSVVIRFRFQPGELEIGLNFIGLDFGPMSDSIQEYRFLAFADSCRVWDRENQVWDNTSCKLSVYSTPEETLCDCQDAPGYNFASSFYVPPNLINFDLVFGKFDPANAAVYGTLIGLFFVFGLAVIWARRKARVDERRWKMGYLEDNLIGDNYFYLLTVHTGLTGSSGTKSNVNFILTGDKGDTGVRILSDGKRYLETGTVMNFVMTTREPIGSLKFLRIWHDNSGKGADQSWYFSKIYVDNIQTHRRSVFLCDQWLAMDKDDGLIDRIIAVSFDDELMTFTKLFSDHSRVNISDTHLWLSIFLRPEKNMFTRVQRVCTCFAMLLLAMISSALFYKAEDPEGNSSNNPGSEVQLGTLRFSMTTLYTSFVGLIVTVPPIVLIVCLFKGRRPWVHTSCTRRCVSCCGRKKMSETKDESYRLSQMKCKLSCLDDKDPMSSKFEKNALPPWCLIVAWVLVAIVILVCSFCLLLYSMQWGKTVSEEWLASFVLSFFESIFILDPIKVVLLATLFALCMRKAQSEPDSDFPIEIIKQQSTKSACKEIDPSILPPDPIPEHTLEAARTRRREEALANGVFVEMLLYVLFIFCIFSVSYINKDTRSFNLNDHIKTYLVKPPFRKARMYYGTMEEPVTWTKMRTLNDVYTWLNGSMKDTLLPWNYPNGEIMPWEQRLFIGDLANYRVGPIRLRQARMPRVKPQKIKDHPTFLGPKITNQVNLVGNTDRSPTYDINGEETGEYCWGWKPLPCSRDEELAAVTLDAWKHRTTREEKSFPVIGKFAIYSGAAYVLDLNINKYILAQLIINELITNSWLDIQTRAVFVEFTLYNANVNLLTSVRLAAEFPEYGGTFVWTDIKPMRVYDHHGGLGALMILCQLITVFVTMFFAFKTFKNLIKQRCKFFMNTWNVLDLFIVIQCVATFIVYIMRKVFVTKVMGRFKSNPKVFVNFYEATLCDDIFGWLLAGIVFMCTIRIMRILGYNQRIVLIATVLKRAGPGLLSFSLLFGIIIGTFMSSGYALFHSNLESFRTLWESYFTIIYLLLGKNVFNKMIKVSAILSRIYFFLLAVLVVFVFLTIFQSILNFTITEVHSDVANTPAPYGIMNVLNKIYASVVLDNRAVEFLKRWSNKEKEDMVPAAPGTGPVAKEDATHIHKILTTLRKEFYSSIEGSKYSNIENNFQNDSPELLNIRALSPSESTAKLCPTEQGDDDVFSYSNPGFTPDQNLTKPAGTNNPTNGQDIPSTNTKKDTQPKRSVWAAGRIRQIKQQ